GCIQLRNFREENEDPVAALDAPGPQERRVVVGTLFELAEGPVNSPVVINVNERGFVPAPLGNVPVDCLVGYVDFARLCPGKPLAGPGPINITQNSSIRKIEGSLPGDEDFFRFYCVCHENTAA